MKFQHLFFAVIFLQACDNTTTVATAKADSATTVAPPIIKSDGEKLPETDTLVAFSAKAFLETGKYQPAEIDLMRHLKSPDGILLDITTGAWKLRGNYYIPPAETEKEHFVTCEGYQKGKEINFKGYNPEAYYEPLYQFGGQINADSGTITGSWKITNKQNAPDEQIRFEPIHSQNNPRLKYNLFTTEIDHEFYVNKIQVTNEKGIEIQVLDGFVARPVKLEVFAEDLNFDGWFDLRIRKDIDIKTGRKDVELFWLYNPASRKFEASKVLNDVEGMYHHIDFKTQILLLSKRDEQGMSNYHGFKFNGLDGFTVEAP